ncbi:MAG: DUF5658 family protein [Gammaproteobacteria bacterium]|nr:DUF5658 family protein [Gammaproteobacteria bacterium]MDH5801908.1 DUF5658 family protein [Gammaproteobacteria bacterium]
MSTIALAEENFQSACQRKTDRRQNVLKAGIYAMYRKRRRQVRRGDDSFDNTYVDTMGTKVFALALVAMTLSITDAFFTTILLQNGSSELNPVLDVLLGHSLYAFLGVKFVLTGMSIGLLALHKHHRLFKLVNGTQLLWACVVGYVILISYEFSMLRHLLLT